MERKSSFTSTVDFSTILAQESESEISEQESTIISPFDDILTGMMLSPYSLESDGIDCCAQTQTAASINNHGQYGQYLFIFIINNSHNHVKSSRRKLTTNSSDNNALVTTAGTYTIDVDYLMNGAYDAIDQLVPYFPSSNSGGYRIELKKKWLDSSLLENFLKEINAGNGNSVINKEMKCKDGSKILDIQYFFVIGSFENQIFNLLMKHKQKIIGPLTIQYWFRMCRCATTSTFDLCKHLCELSKPLFSECMKDTMVYLSKSIPLDDLLKLYERIRLMGGCITNQLDLEVTHAVSEALLEMMDQEDGDNCSQQTLCQSSSDLRINAAACFEIPVVTIDWINVAWSHLQLQYMFASNKDFVAAKLQSMTPNARPILKSFIIGIFPSVYSQQQNFDRLRLHSATSRINNVIVRFGGTFVNNPNSLNFEKINLVLHLSNTENHEQHDLMDLTQLNQINRNVMSCYQRDQQFTRLNERRGSRGQIPILTIGWLFDSIINLKAQPFEPYQIKIRKHISKPQDTHEINRISSNSSIINVEQRQLSLNTNKSSEDKSMKNLGKSPKKRYEDNHDKDEFPIAWLGNKQDLMDHLDRMHKSGKKK